MNKTRFVAIVKGENHTIDGVVDGIDLDGVYVRMRNPCFATKDQVEIGFCIKDSDGVYSVLLEVHARVARVDREGVRFYFRPMALSDHEKLKAITEFVSNRKVSDRDHQEGIVFTRLSGDYQAK